MRLLPFFFGLVLLPAAPLHGGEETLCPAPSALESTGVPAPTAEYASAHRKHRRGCAESARRRGAHMMLLRRLLLDKYDRNGDDLVDGGERQQLLRDAHTAKEKALRNLIARFDKDGDGKLDAAELEHLQECVRPAARVHPARPDGSGNSPPPAPLPPPPPGSGPLALLTQQLLLGRYDANGDGKLSEQERTVVNTDADELFARRTKELLSRFDQNADGLLDHSECARARRLLREEREFGREPDVGAPLPDPIDIYLDTFYDMDVIHALGDRPKK